MSRIHWRISASLPDHEGRLTVELRGNDVTLADAVELWLYIDLSLAGCYIPVPGVLESSELDTRDPLNGPVLRMVICSFPERWHLFYEGVRGTVGGWVGMKNARLACR
jgi:hypothetical protein